MWAIHKSPTQLHAKPARLPSRCAVLYFHKVATCGGEMLLSCCGAWLMGIKLLARFVCIFADGKNNGSAPSSRRRQRSSALHLDGSNLAQQKKTNTIWCWSFFGAASQIWTGDLILTNGIFAVLYRFEMCENVLICNGFSNLSCCIVAKLWRPFYNLGRHLVAKLMLYWSLRVVVVAVCVQTAGCIAEVLFRKKAYNSPNFRVWPPNDSKSRTTIFKNGLKGTKKDRKSNDSKPFRRYAEKDFEPGPTDS